MDGVIAFCGLDCAQCLAYQATKANDRAWMEEILAKWRVEYNNPEMPIEAVMCDGCTAKDGRHGGYCAECPVRKCAVGRGVENCAGCPDYACEELTKFFAMAPAAKENLDLLRRTA